MIENTKAHRAHAVQILLYFFNCIRFHCAATVLKENEVLTCYCYLLMLSN